MREDRSLLRGNTPSPVRIGQPQRRQRGTSAYGTAGEGGGGMRALHPRK